MGVATVIMATRTTHQNDSIEIMGMTARPAPRMTAARQCESASRQKNSEQVRIFCTPKAMAAGSWVKALMRMGASQYSSAPTASAMMTEHRMPNRAPCRVRLSSPAQVLPDEGGNGRGKAGNGQEGEALHLGIGAAAAHGHLAKGIDIGLHHYIGQRDDGIL